MTLVDPKLVFTDIEAKSSMEIINFLANKLYKSGKVTTTFNDAINNREKKYPTGLPTGKIKVAIPHTDARYVKKSAIAFVNLKYPVKFQNMAVNEETLNVSVVVMLAISEPHGQVQTLEKLMSVFQNKTYLNFLAKETDSNKIYEKLSTTL